ncbi:MAG: RsmB/NOP family class I SAM-dependent RNA methyltransferase [Rhodospirillales bacterium]|nr:RsmB/NOP family class I SAM-dependent RNA methyltransferase [Rhodospirillales bacterium]MBO6785961.1 RsmB/NOP family class I SAM-dependent RNA methyltransferase [Rhodospirillales bacterium]
MTPGARIQATVDLLAAIDAGDQPPDQVIDGYFRTRRYAGSGDRRDISARVYDVMRRAAKLDWWIERTGLGFEPGPRSRTIAFLVLEERAQPDDFQTMFSGVKHCPEPLSGPENALADALYGRPMLNRDMPDHVRLEYPEWMDRSFRALWGNALEREMSALNQPAPLDLRVNTIKATPEEALARLQEDYVTCEPTPLSPLGIRVEGKVRLGGTRAFKEGLVDVQDEGSQLVALLAGARPGYRVVDFCAGAGGKTLAMAAAMADGGKIAGQLFALDISKYRLDRMIPRLKRAGAMAVKRRVIAAVDDPWIAENTGMADRVLCDVPCTGTGSWRRNPDARWRFTPESLAEIRETQQRILVDASKLVKPGGRLIYVTCSLLQEENEQQLAWFVEKDPRFQPLPIEDVWAKTVGGPPPPPGPSLRLSPASTGTDGFFCAVLERQS